MHRTVLLVVVLICGLTEAFHNPEKEAIRNRIAVQQRLDYIKRYCPIAEQYDTMVVEYCIARETCDGRETSNFYMCNVGMMISLMAVTTYMNAACPGETPFGQMQDHLFPMYKRADYEKYRNSTRASC